MPLVKQSAAPLAVRYCEGMASPILSGGLLVSETTLPSAAARRVVADLRELARLTSTEAGAQRPAWSAMWRAARSWFAEKVRTIGLSVEADAAGNHWVTL